jgi:hypothetical protein
MSSGKFPRATLNDVPPENSDPMIVMVPMSTMDIGARRSGMPNEASTGPKPIVHVGGSGNKQDK